MQLVQLTTEMNVLGQFDSLVTEVNDLMSPHLDVTDLLSPHLESLFVSCDPLLVCVCVCVWCVCVCAC
jgi:hypothetical protein